MLEYGYEDLDEAERRSGLAGGAGPPLAVDEWLKRDLPVPDFLIGSWFTTTSRLILNAPTGLGKTNFMLAKFAHIAAGIDFLHWKCRRQRRVLFVDGEMSRRLLKQRVEDVVRRMGVTPDGLHLLSHEDVDDFQPLNTVAGREIIESTIERMGGVDAICFDNIMSLILGDMKEEEAWRETLPLITSLTKRNKRLSSGRNRRGAVISKARKPLGGPMSERQIAVPSERDHLGRSSEQAGHRRGHRSPMVRCRTCRCRYRSREFGGWIRGR